MKPRYLINILVSIPFCIFLEELVTAQTSASMMQRIYVSVYFVLLILAANIGYEKLLRPRIEGKKRWRAAGLSLLFTAVIALTCTSNILPRYFESSTVTITPTGSHSTLSQGSEVQIQAVSENKSAIRLSTIELPDESWYFNDTNIVCVPTNDTKPLVLHFDKANQININFLQNKWAGIIEINGVSQDLYAEEDNTFQYNLHIPSETPLFVSLCTLVSLAVLFYLVILLPQLRKNLAMVAWVALHTILFGFSGFLPLTGFGNFALLCGVIMAVILASVQVEQEKGLRTSRAVISLIIGIGISALLFLLTGSLSLQTPFGIMQTVLAAMLFGLYFSPIVYMVCYWFMWVVLRGSSQKKAA